MLELIRPGLLALRQYWKPFLLIEFCGFALVIGYFLSSRVREAADVLAAWKAAGGLIGAALASAVSGAVLPEVAKTLVLGDTEVSSRRWRDLVFHAGLFAVLGVLGDRFYVLVAHLFGDGPSLSKIAAKVATDQFLYSTLVALPVTAFAFHLRQEKWRPGPVLRALSPRWYAERVLTLAVICWCFWIPMTSVMYALPKELTFCFAMFAQAAWAILLTFAASHRATQTPPALEALVEPIEPARQTSL